MSDDDDITIFYGLEDLYDEIEVPNYSQSVSERPICDSLKKIETNYVDYKEIARGGMKRIFKVLDTKLNRHVALAKLHINAPTATHDSFIREARLTALLEHPNIISIYDIAISDDDTPFFTMELKVGDNLGSIIKKSVRGIEPALQESLLESFIKVCDAVSFAHSKNVLHLDLKPENIQLGEFGEVIVCDWGLGKVIGDDDDFEFDQILFNRDLLNNITLADEIKGTPGYMSPEQVVENGEKTKQTDIYSLGAVLYTILTGRAAFTGDVSKVLDMTATGVITEPINVSEKRDVPEGLNAVVMKAMSLAPEDRYQTVEELKNEVHCYLSGRATVAEHAGLAKEVLLFYKRNLLVCNIVLYFVVTLIVLGGGFVIKLQQQNVRLAEERDRADLNRMEAELEKTRVKSAMVRMKIEIDLVDSLLKKGKEQVQEIFSYTDREVYMDPIGALKKAEGLLREITPDKPQYVWSVMQLGYVHFLRQEFSMASEFFKLSPSNVEDLFALCTEYKEKVGSNGLLPIDDMVRMVGKMIGDKYRLPEALKMMKYDREMRPLSEDHSKLVMLLLKYINPKWNGGTLAYNPETYSLSIRGSGFVRIELASDKFYQRGPSAEKPISFIDTLQVKQLDVSYTDVTYMYQFIGHGIEELKMIGCPLNELTVLWKMDSLKRLIVAPGQLKDWQVQQVPDHVAIIVEK